MISQDLGSPAWTSALLERIRKKGPARASAGDWLRFVLASSEQGISKDEIKFSRIAHALLAQHDERDLLSRQRVLATAALKPLMPRLLLTLDDSFRPTDNWRQCASLIPAKQYTKRDLFGAWPASVYVVRYRHHSLGWSVAMARHTDLFQPNQHWWLVLDSKGARVGDQPPYGFLTAREAMAHASLLIQRQFTKSARARHAPRWERFSLHGLGPYAELLITLPAWPGSFSSRVHFPGVHNLLVHLRTNVCNADDGRRVLFLDEVQSDWHALATKERLKGDDEGAPPQGVPFARDWPLLAMKFALWWAARQGIAGVAWSTPELHLRRWHGHKPPTEVYRRALPEAAAKLARLLPLDVSTAGLLRRRVRPAAGQRWQVLSKAGVPVCRSFETRAQADQFADLTGARWRHELPVLWMTDKHPFDRMPLFGVGDAALWAGDPKLTSQAKTGKLGDA